MASQVPKCSRNVIIYHLGLSRSPYAKLNHIKMWHFYTITITKYAAADIVVSTEHTIDGRVVDVKRAVPRDMAPAPTRYRELILSFYDTPLS
jgi:hypothetical protein